ncbi:MULTISPECIES: AAA family ATPase [Paenibacillus]|uniref:AAA family ATPase n=1 Tax=Paenibacillus TaxID=44249 RepID=UPI00203AA186|nr:AAA family ATPase [Paenibacillus camelliae]MCM3632854.1 AAA family ATPase [Paenibacillus camelliae]
MSSKVIASDSIIHSRPSRQINVVLRNPEPTPVISEPPSLEERTIQEEKTNTHHLFAEFEEQLNAMVGMEQVKAIVYEIYALLHISRMRQEMGLSQSSHVYHMIFKGNPGTGKTTIARIVAKLFQKMGVLSKGHLIEVERADLVGEYIGHTAQKTRDLIKKAMGGVLFIDEAYSLARGGEKDFGKEAIDTLVKHMEDSKNQFILILAGYPYEIEQFLLTNPGLPSRFPLIIDFPDYSTDQLMEIGELMMKERDYVLSQHAAFKLRQLIMQAKQTEQFSFSNARYVRNLLEKAVRQHAVRLMNHYPRGTPSKNELMSIRSEDIK